MRFYRTKYVPNFLPNLSGIYLPNLSGIYLPDVVYKDKFGILGGPWRFWGFKKEMFFFLSQRWTCTCSFLRVSYRTLHTSPPSSENHRMPLDFWILESEMSFSAIFEKKILIVASCFFFSMSFTHLDSRIQTENKCF